MKNAVYPLFPAPLMICGTRYRFSLAERKYFDELEMIENTGNRMSRNDHVLDSEELKELRAFIDEQILNYKENLVNIKTDNEIYITQSWINRSQASEYHHKHKHPNSVISGVMFLDDNSDGTLPPIRFHRAQEIFPMEFEYDALNEFNATCQTFDPEEGMLILFPSLIEHDVDKNESECTRTSLSFNTYVRGVVGGRRTLSEITIS